ncbi:MAG: TOBE domain-containing protein [Candidatus Helarchaeota archaeon]|nr:TOBE domain-containing protein [Candidatus Helarchaeota archaeon]
MKISTRNKFKTTIKELQVQGLISTLHLSINEPAIVTAVITKEAADEMDIKIGDEINIVVNPTEIIIQQLKKLNEAIKA